MCEVADLRQQVSEAAEAETELVTLVSSKAKEWEVIYCVSEGVWCVRV